MCPWSLKQCRSKGVKGAEFALRVLIPFTIITTILGEFQASVLAWLRSSVLVKARIANRWWFYQLSRAIGGVRFRLSFCVKTSVPLHARYDTI